MVEVVKTFGELKYLAENWIKVYDLKCPVCGSPVFVRPFNVFSVAAESGLIEIEMEQICQNSECGYSAIRFYDIQIHE
ncbi:MAG: hypothetical protein WED07_01010 [Candidatus Freyarchaeum deiterrae]